MSDDADLTIKFRIDDSDARAKLKRAGEDQDRVTAKADQAAKRIAAGATKAADAQAAGAKRAGDAHAKAAEKAEKSWDAAGQAGVKFAESFKSLVLANASFAGVSSAVTAIAAAFGEGNKKIDDYAKSLIKVKDDLKELATLKGLVSADDKFIKGIADFGRATGLTITESDAYQRQYLGSLAAGQQSGNITADTAEDLMVQGARVASRQTHDLSTRGDLLGVISQFQKLAPGRAGTEQALSTAESVRQGLTEGRGDDAPLTKALLNVAGSFVGDKGPVPTLNEMAALVGTTSLSAGAGAADSRAEALIRALRGSTPEQVAFLRSQGVKETGTFQEKFNTLAPKLRAQQAAGRDLGTYLMESGFNDEQARALAENVPLQDTLNKRMAAARNARSGAALIAESDALARTDPNQRMRLAEAELKAAELARGVERQAIQPDITAGRAALVASGRDTDPVAIMGDWARSAGSLWQVSGLDTRAKAEALARLRKQAGVGEGFGETAARTLFGDPGVAMLQGLSSVTGNADRELLALRELVALREAVEKQTRAVTNAIDGQTRKLEPGRAPEGPLAPASPPSGWTR